MSTKRKQVLHISSSIQGKQPKAGDLDYGELAVNYNSNGGFISFKDSANVISRVSDDKTMASIMELKEVVPYKGETKVNDLDKNESEINVTLNQKVGSKTPHADEINVSTGFTIDMNGYVMNGSSPAFNNLSASGETDLNKLTVSDTLKTKNLEVTDKATLNNVAISGTANVKDLVIEGHIVIPTTGSTEIVGKDVLVSGETVSIEGENITIARDAKYVDNPLSSTTVDDAIDESFNRSKVTISKDEENDKYTFIQDGEEIGSITSSDDVTPYKKGTGKESAILGKDGGQVAEGDYSVAEGWQTQAKNNYEHAFGYFNESITDNIGNDSTIFTVGNGTSDTNRKNAFEIHKDGTIYLYVKNEKVCLNELLSALLDKTF